VNFVTAHDGFTLADLVSYNDKHNDANGEDNRDGESYNRSWNCGVEGSTRDADVLALRARQKRNFLATLLLSQGIPMILGGDELGRSQGGNNNAYCQDNRVSWFDWARVDDAMSAFASALVDLRRSNVVFRRRRFFHGRPLHGSGVSDIGWFTAAGTEMTDADWEDNEARAMGVFLNGHDIPGLDPRGERVVGDSFLVLLNAGPAAVSFTLPKDSWGESWVKVLDTWEDGFEQADPPSLAGGEELEVGDRGLVLLRQVG
jgi:glycogen operon protein